MYGDMFKIAICDDEYKTCSDIENTIQDFFARRGESCETEVWYSSESLCRDISTFNPDILFLDIELPAENGVFAGKYIRDDLHKDTMNIVYISHKTNYALELFKIHPYDFLVKPISAEQICSTIEKILKLDEIQNREFRFAYNKTNYMVPYGEIMYFSSWNKTVNIHKANGETLKYYDKLNNIQGTLPLQFVRISKSYIVNMKYITSWKYNLVVLNDGVELNIAQSHRTTFKQSICNYNLTVSGGG